MNTATYSPEDNKLRLYPESRLGELTYKQVKEAGFKWAPKQELFVAPMWTPEREDLLIELCGEIGDEDTSLVERAEQRAERFEDYSESRAADAASAHARVEQITDGIPLGQPILVGHHSEKHARKHAEKIHNGMQQAVKMWEQSQYWKDRARGAVYAAKYKELPAVRARRIKGLEADKRKQERGLDESQKLLNAWEHEKMSYEFAIRIANHDHISMSFSLADYPRDLPASQYEGPMSLWSALNDKIITAEQAAAIAIPCHERRIARCLRWIAHYENRLTYERAMQDEGGGIPADNTKPEKGGACRCWCSPGYGKGWSYIQKVNKVSVSVEDNWGNGDSNFKRTIPFDKLTALMSKEQVDRARAEGRIHEATTGFYLDEPAETRDEAKQRVHKEAVKAAEKEQAAPFQAIKDALKDGVKVVVANQLFPTPPDLARQAVALAGVSAGQRVLEPSAGSGNMIRAILQRFTGADCGKIVAVEINHNLAEALTEQRNKTVYANESNFTVVCKDFLECGEELGKFDRVIMNPPFERAADIKHILHAKTFLKPGGKLAAICANGPRQNEQLKPLASKWIDLPEGSFKEQGTNVNTALILIEV